MTAIIRCRCTGHIIQHRHWCIPNALATCGSRDRLAWQEQRRWRPSTISTSLLSMPRINCMHANRIARVREPTSGGIWQLESRAKKKKHCFNWFACYRFLLLSCFVDGKLLIAVANSYLPSHFYNLIVEFTYRDSATRTSADTVASVWKI